MGKRITNFALLFLIISSILPAQENMEPKENTVDTSVKISGQWFMAYRGNIPSEGDDSFGLKRGYLTFKKTLTTTFPSVIHRISPSIKKGMMQEMLKFDSNIVI